MVPQSLVALLRESGKKPSCLGTSTALQRLEKDHGVHEVVWSGWSAEGRRHVERRSSTSCRSVPSSQTRQRRPPQLLLVRGWIATDLASANIPWRPSRASPSRCGQWQAALGLLDAAMLEGNLQPNLIVYNAAISACGKAACWSHAVCLISEPWHEEASRSFPENSRSPQPKHPKVCREDDLFMAVRNLRICHNTASMQI